MDQSVEPYLRAAGGSAEEVCLGELTQLAEPIIRRTVAARLGGRWDDIDDVCSEARLELLLYLRRLKASSRARPVDDFASYVATLARNTCHHYFRRRHAGRVRLKRQITFLLSEADFKTWQRQGIAWCGLPHWTERSPTRTAPDITAIEGSRDLQELLHHIFKAAGGPLELGVLVDLVARKWGIPSDIVETDVDLNTLPARSQSPESAIDLRRFTQRLWREIRELPRSQRLALLLSLRDGRGNSVLALFPLLRVASFPETASVLELTEADLARIWVELPWDDTSIAGLLGIARQQVINLRMSARKRLANRLGDRPR